jgi:hypothetical protein
MYFSTTQILMIEKFLANFYSLVLSIRTHVGVAKIARSRYFCNRHSYRLKPSLHQGFIDRTHVRRLKNGWKSHGETVLIFWQGELPWKANVLVFAANISSKCFAPTKIQERDRTHHPRLILSKARSALAFGNAKGERSSASLSHNLIRPLRHN